MYSQYDCDIINCSSFIIFQDCVSVFLSFKNYKLLEMKQRQIINFYFYLISKKQFKSFVLKINHVKVYALKIIFF